MKNLNVKRNSLEKKKRIKRRREILKVEKQEEKAKSSLEDMKVGVLRIKKKN